MSYISKGNVTYDTIDIKENDICRLSPELLQALLKDHTMSSPDRQVNIFWATDDYADRGDGYQYGDSITVEAITGKNGYVIQPRAVKNRQTQQQRSREMAEVFTPSWICNKQNNLVDAAWFGREGVFNTEHDTPDGLHTWQTTGGVISFPDGKTWRDYVRDVRMEITCGEAPYLVSPYDTVTGDPIPIPQRIGILDRKLRVVGEQTSTTAEWLEWAQVAFKSCYGYEWQGDNLILARENLLYTFRDYYRAKFHAEPLLKSMTYIAYIVSWNIFQMDGLRGVVPGTCGLKKSLQLSFFEEPKMEECEGCKCDDIFRHNGTYALIRDWGAKAKQKIRFIDLIKNK